MNDALFKVTVAALLHDIGKVIYRANILDNRSHPISGYDFIKDYTEDKDILDAIRYHHEKHLSNANLPEESIAYITCFSDNIAAAADRRQNIDYIEGDTENKGFDMHIPMATVFNLIHNNNKNMCLEYKSVQEINFPQKREDKISISASQYNRCYQNIKEGLAGIKIEADYINSLLELLETHLAYVPSSTMTTQVPDISLYDHQKLTAAISSCIYLYLTEKQRNNFRQELYINKENFSSEKCLLMFSCDISGIQNFIYTISSKGALKGLRSRSFYLEMLLEHIADRLVQQMGLTRANIIYTGGGHAYILLPNTEKAKDIVGKAMKKVNRWFMEKFGTLLFIAADYVECSCNDLVNIPHKEAPYSRVFRELSWKLSAQKQKRYTADDIRLLNSSSMEFKGRECPVCGSIDIFEGDNEGEEKKCHMCYRLDKISAYVTKNDSVIITCSEPLEGVYSPYLLIPSLEDGSDYLYILSRDTAIDILKKCKEQVLNVYGRNKMHTGLYYSKNLWTGTYNYKKGNNTATFEELAQEASGISRLGVLRADVDNLGVAFVSGFVRDNEHDNEKKYRYQTLSRTATLSRQMSLFFKYYINLILEKKVDGIEPFSLSGETGMEPGGRKAVIVYSGGDDLFIVGAWDEIIEAAVDMKRAFDKFSAGTLTFSAGIGVFPAKYPISRMADLTAQLEEAAKSLIPGKNAISLFGMDTFIRNGEFKTEALHTYKWDVFIENVIGDKLRLIQKYLNDFEESKGITFLYNLADLVKRIDEDRINIARIAYLLGRVAPNDDKKRESFNDFSNRVYKWIFNPDDRRQLLTAIQIYIYLNRKEREES